MTKGLFFHRLFIIWAMDLDFQRKSITFATKLKAHIEKKWKVLRNSILRCPSRYILTTRTGSDFLMDGGATASYFYGPLNPIK